MAVAARRREPEPALENVPRDRACHASRRMVRRSRDGRRGSRTFSSRLRDIGVILGTVYTQKFRSLTSKKRSNQFFRYPRKECTLNAQSFIKRV